MYRSFAALCAFCVLAVLQGVAASPAAASGGMASYYSYDFAGKPTASGERFNPGALTAASRTLPFGTLVRVTNRNTGRSVVVRINDRGPFVGGRVIDLSRAAAASIGMLASGVAPVSIEVVGGSRGTMVASKGTSHKRYASARKAGGKTQVAMHRAKAGKVQVASAKQHRHTAKTQLAMNGVYKVKHHHASAFAQ